MPRRREPSDRLEAEAVARVFADLTPGRLERKILEELIYERVRVSVDLCELMAFELDLSESISRALSACAQSPRERGDLAMEYLKRAWDRVTDEVLGTALDQELAEVDPADDAGAPPA